MSHTNTTNLALTKPEHRDPDTYETWDAVVNTNMDLIDASVGSRVYTSHFAIQNSEALATSLNALDAALLIVNGFTPTTDEHAALTGVGGSPSVLNPYATKDYVRINQNLIIVPEYAGAVLYASGANNTGTLTSGMEEDATIFRRNYYKWTSVEATLQSYDLALQVLIPQTFLSWQAKALQLDICTSDTVATNCKVDVTITKDGTVTAAETVLGIVGTVASTWYGNKTLSGGGDSALITFTDTEFNTLGLVAGSVMNISIRMYAKSTAWVKIGNITLAWKC